METTERRWQAIKPDFDNVVRGQNRWLTAFVRRKMNGNGMYEDLVQEIFIKAFLAYDDYTEEGKIRAWLARIAENVLRNYFGRERPLFCLSLDAETDDGGSLGDTITDGLTPEEGMLEKETVEEILCAVHRLPQAQRTVFAMRYLDGLSVSDISANLRIPAGTVKSQTYYAVRKIRKKLGLNLETGGKNKMTCKECYDYLLVYSLGKLTGDMKSAMDEHLASCETCRGMAQALGQLLPQMQFGKDDETSFFAICFPEAYLWLFGYHYFFRNAENIKRHMEENGGKVPRGIVDMIYDSRYEESLTLFNGEGSPIVCDVVEENNGARIRKYPRIIPHFDQSQWFYNATIIKDDFNSYRESGEVPGLFYGSMNNALGAAAKAMLYHAIPAKAENIRVKRGNGVIDCGTYLFAYADRYVTEDETLRVEYSFQMK